MPVLVLGTFMLLLLLEEEEEFAALERLELLIAKLPESSSEDTFESETKYINANYKYD